ncbi:MAG: hypothetical protein GX333_01710 [Syntrophomonadaceae bacterium]|nr:hypothetical protein [Syntrophomonadaceae bacterium]
MDDMLKTLIILVLIYYLLKGLIYIVLWQATYKIQERALEAKAKKQAEREERRKAKSKPKDEEV